MSKISAIEIVFPVPVDMPDGWEKALSGLVGMVCEKYERENPERVMWPSGHGAKPIWREPEEPDFDDAVYQIEVVERGDFYGKNPHNPNAEELKKQSRRRRKAGLKAQN